MVRMTMCVFAIIAIKYSQCITYRLNFNDASKYIALSRTSHISETECALFCQLEEVIYTIIDSSCVCLRRILVNDASQNMTFHTPREPGKTFYFHCNLSCTTA